MRFLLTNFKNKWYGFVALLMLPLCFGGFTNAASAGNLLDDVMIGARNYETITDMGNNEREVGESVFQGSTELGGGLDPTGLYVGTSDNPSIIVKITRLLLSVVIALSVTMILYNGMSYIIQTGQGKEGKNLVSNIVYIIIGILISLFSVAIITIIESVTNTLDEELTRESNNYTDNQALEGQGQKFYLIKRQP